MLCCARSNNHSPESIIVGRGLAVNYMYVVGGRNRLFEDNELKITSYIPYVSDYTLIVRYSKRRPASLYIVTCLCTCMQCICM